jgi:hypothetical protein
LTSDAEQAAFLEQVRRSGIRIDREGELWHEGQPIAHEGLRRALYRWLDRSPEGRYVFRLDEARFANVEVADTPLVARAARWDDESLWLALSDGAEERLDPSTLTVDAAGILRGQVRGGRLEARLANSAAAVLAERLDATGLHIDGRVLQINRRP